MRPIEMMMAEGENAAKKKEDHIVDLMKKMICFQKVTKDEALKVMVYHAQQNTVPSPAVISGAVRAMYSGEPKVVAAEAKTASICEEIGTVEGMSVFRITKEGDKPFYNLTGSNSGYYDLGSLLKLRGKSMKDFNPN